MFYYKQMKDKYREVKIGPVGNFLKYVKKHSCYKAAEKLLLHLSDINKECAAIIHQSDDYNRVELIFEEIELSEEEKKAACLLGKTRNVLIQKSPILIQITFTFKDINHKEDSLDLCMRKYWYIGYNETYSNCQETGWIKQQRQSVYILTYKSPDKVYFKGRGAKSFPVTITTLYIICNSIYDVGTEYAILFVTSMLEYISEITGTKIYIDLLKEKTSDGELLNPCRLKLTDLKGYRTKKELFYGKYGKFLNKYQIYKDTFNKHTFQWNYRIVSFIKYFGGTFIPELLKLEECIDKDIPQKNLKDLAIDTFKQILLAEYPLLTNICKDIVKMLFMLRRDSLKEMRKHLPERNILEGRKKLMEYHDSLVNVIEELYEDDVFDEMGIEHKKTQDQIKQDRKVYECFAEQLPSPWKEFTEPEELVHESHIMENCIRTYCQDLTAAECGLYWAEINGRRYNAEVIFNKDENRMDLIQLFGKRNEKPEKKDVLLFEEYVRKFKYCSFNFE